MNRRELFKGLAAFAVVASLPLPAMAVVEAMPRSEALAFLLKIRQDYLYKLVNPPMIMHEDGRLETLPQDHVRDILKFLDQAIEEERSS